MSEDYIVQQQPSAAPYALGGAVVGGGTAAALSNWGPQWAREKGKYASFEDILKESKDDFVKNNEGIAEQAVTDLETARTAIEKAGNDYETQLKEYLENNKAGATPELPADSEALKKVKEAEQKLAERRAELEKLEAEKIRKAGREKPSGRVDADKLRNEIERANNLRRDGFNSKIDSFVERKFELLDQLEAAKSKGDTAKIKELTGKVKELESEIDRYLDTEVKEWFTAPNKKLKGKAREDFEKLKNNTSELINIRIDEKMIDSATDISMGKKYETALAKLKPGISDKMYNHIVEKGAVDARTIENLTSIRDKRVANIRTLLNLKTEYETAYKAAAKAGKIEETEVTKILFGLIERTTGKKPTDKTIELALEDFLKDADAETQKIFKQVVKGDITLENLDKAIEAYEKQTTALNQGISELKYVSDEVERIGGKNAYIKDGIVYDAKGKTVAEKLTATRFETARAGITTNIPGVREHDIRASLTGTAADGTKLTEEQIAAQAKKAVTDDMLTTEQKAVDEARKAADAERAKLPKAEGKPAEELRKEFIEKHGTKDDAMKKATEEQKGKICDELKALFEKGKIKGGKLAWITAAGVGAGALIGLMFKPKNETV